MSEKEELRTVACKVDEDLYWEIKRNAATLKTSQGEYIEAALRHYVTKQKIAEDRGES